MVPKRRNRTGKRGKKANKDFLVPAPVVAPARVVVPAPVVAPATVVVPAPVSAAASVPAPVSTAFAAIVAEVAEIYNPEVNDMVNLAVLVHVLANTANSGTQTLHS